MKYLKTNAIGVDAKINAYINKIDKVLNENGGWDIDIYHKIYRESLSGKYVPHVFLSNNEYKEVFINDKVIGEVGFYLNNQRIVETNISVDCDIIFSVNLKKIDGGSLQREDERAIMMAFNAVNSLADVSSINTELRNVFSEFDTERIKYRDMHPFLNFSFSFNIIYKNNNCYGM